MQEYNKYNDTEIIKMLVQSTGKRADKLFDVLYERYSAKLNVYCIFKAQNKQDAEEIFEDTWLKFLSRIRDGKTPNSVLPYLYSIAHNLIIDKYRTENSKKKVIIEYKDFTEFDENNRSWDIENELEQNELIEIVKRVLTTIDEIYSETFLLQWFGGLSQQEIADLLGISISAVKMRSHRAMKEVIKYVKPFYSYS